MFTLIKIRLAQIKYELKNLGIIHIIFLTVIFVILEITLHAAFSKYPQWATLALLLVILTQHFSRKDMRFVNMNVEKPLKSLFFDHFFLISPFISVALFTTHWYCFFLILIAISVISRLKFGDNNQSTGLFFLSRIIPSTHFEVLSGCRQNYIFFWLIALYILATGLCWVRGLPLFLLWLMTTAISSFFGEYEPLDILRKDLQLSSNQFLNQKLMLYLIPLSIIYTPILIANTLFHPDLGIINGLFLILQLLSFNFAILHKYATYYPKAYFNTNNPILILVGMCNLIPYLMPVVLLLDIKYYLKAIKNLDNYLQ
jgi:hypothetical protein